jgi:predicted dienelactone hydrolase
MPLMIFSHGLGGTCTAYLGLFKELASHGFIVMGLDDINGSCSYTQTEKGE